MDERKMIYLEDAIKAVCDEFRTVYCYNCANQESEDQCEWCHRKSMGWSVSRDTVERILNNLPSAQPEPLSDAYMKAVWTWLLNYQIKAAELKGRYTPYEVLSWVANDWTKLLRHRLLQE